MTQTLLPAQGPVDVNVSPLPCPHCGSDDLYGPHLTEYIGDTRHPHWWIACNRCPGGMQVDGETAKPLIDAWNMRANASLTDAEPVGGASELKRYLCKEVDMECKCNMREKLVGDGCEVCNPAKALEYAKGTIADLEARLREIGDYAHELKTDPQVFDAEDETASMSTGAPL